MEVNFLFSNELVHELEKLIRSSKKYLLLVSPYIDLDDRIRAALKEKIEDPHFKLEVLYGKNRAYPYKSVKKDSFEFLMQFPNIEIKHEEILHAKFYQNESHFIMTSMNLYDYSLANNFEVGVIAKYASTGFVGKISDKTDAFVNDGVDKLKEGVFGISEKEVNPILRFKQLFQDANPKYCREPEMVKKGGIAGALGNEKMIAQKVLHDFISTQTNQKPSVIKSSKKETKSASQISKQLGILNSEFRLKVEELGLVKEGTITDAGFARGLVMKNYKGNEYIAFPTDIIPAK